ncbi:MAG: J domain-containing protein [Sphingomonadaceae bacterium]
MGKIHTHYDNLKVSRMAPPEVIRAAYKALSQKYHPDKNPGDEKAARIMAILNSAYGTLSDPQRRKEHDEWIAAEEWEVEWLESTRHEEARGDRQRSPAPQQAWSDQVEEPHAVRRRPGWKVWTALGSCLVLGWVGGVTMVAEPRLLSSALSSAWGGKTEAPVARTVEPRRVEGRLDGRSDGHADVMLDSWAVGRPYYPDSGAVKPPPIKVVALSQVVLPGATADCENDTQTLVAPNGEPWPTQSGYVDGFPVAAKGDDMQLTVDNASNASAVFIKVYDMERHSNVRYAFVQAHDKLVVDKLVSGRYEIRYQNVDLGANQTGCAARKTAAASAPASPVSN